MQGIGNKGKGCNKNLILMKKTGKTEPKKNTLKTLINKTIKSKYKTLRK